MAGEPQIVDWTAPLPTLTLQQLHRVERLLQQAYGLDPVTRLDRLGQQLALAARLLLEDDLADRPVVVLAGRGCTGGGGLAAARQLLDWGAWVQLVLTGRPASYTGPAAQQLALIHEAGAPLAWAEEGWELPPTDLVIDALLSYGLQGEPYGPVRELIQLANSSVAPILSWLAPSGLDVAVGVVQRPAIQATATLAMAPPLAALLAEPGRSACGELLLADLGAPPELYQRLGLEPPPSFAGSQLLRLTP